ncbi:microaggregate invasion protein 1 [Mycobacterium marinum]|nr:hypothetical protein [Mycobacterium marinum]
MNDHTEWALAVHDMTEMERAATEVELRWAAGMCGDREDAHDE